jgi:hypothetical protein
MDFMGKFVYNATGFPFTVNSEKSTFKSFVTWYQSKGIYFEGKEASGCGKPLFLGACGSGI